MQLTTPLKPLCLFVLQALACQAMAAETANAPAGAVGAAAAPMQVVQIIGQGQSRQVQNITRADLAQVVPGTSPLKALEKLPGVSFQSADPFGAYEWSTRFSIRGFAQTQLGFTLDGIPLGDMSYGNNNGLHISRAVSSENIGSVAVSQGSGALATASTSNLGGTVQFITQDPSDQIGVTFAQTIGSDRTSRTFARVDSGLLGSGGKFFLSATRQRADKWKGAGAQDQDQFNSRFVQAIGEHQLSGFFNYSDRSEEDYQDLSLEMVKRLGYNWDNFAPDFNTALLVAAAYNKNPANPIFPAGIKSVDDAYYSAGGLRKDKLGGLTLDLALSPAVSLKTSVYHHDNKGQGYWYTPYVVTSATMPISIRTTEYTIDRNGVISDLTWDLGNHTVATGFWVDNSDHGLARNFYAINGPEAAKVYRSNPFRTDFKQDFVTKTTQYYLQDTISLLDGKLKMNVGFKSPKVSIDAVGLVGTRAVGSITASKSFLPQVGLNYALSRNDELFASASQNMRAYQPGVTGPFSQSQAGYNLSTPNLKPETSVTFDLGARFKRDALQGSIALYHADFSDRVLNLVTCPGIVGCPSTFVNVGKVATNGLEAIALWKFDKRLTWFNSFTLNESTYRSDYLQNGVNVPVSGKQVVDTPRTMFSTELAFDNGVWYVRGGAKYTAKRYYTYLNDASVPDHTLATVSAGYHFKNVGVFKDLSLQFNVSNLFDKAYISTIGSNGFARSDPNGTEQTLLSGAPRQFFLTINGKL